MKKLVKSSLVIIVVVLISAVYLTVSMFIFGNSTNTLIRDTTQMYIDENVKAMAAIFNTKLEDQLVMLESQVRYFRDIDLSDYNAMRDRIMQTKGIGAFKNIGVANTTGATINYNGKSSGNIMLTDYFKAVMQGHDSISQSTYKDEDGDEVLVLAVPIVTDGKVVGTVYGTFTKDILNNLVETVSFGEASANVLFDDDGTVLAYSQDTSFINASDTNLYTMVNYDDSKADEVIHPYKKGNTEMFAAITSVGVHGWNFATLLPSSVITDVTKAIGRYVIYIIFAISVVFVMLLGSILLLMKNLNSARKDKARITAELGVATKIQADMLPTDFPVRSDLELCATMTPAKEVGGDFYDFFFVDDDHIALVMADVSGKGVPASLFMAISKVVLRNQVMVGGTPSEILETVNNILCANNSAGLFVTVWLGILDLNTGEISCSNAGHEYPVVNRLGKGFEVAEGENCPPLAAMEDMVFDDEKIVLQPGDSIFLYTDGVPEAKNAGGARFGMEAMTAGLNEGASLSPDGLLKSLKEKIDTFVGELDPFDDITMMSLTYKGRENK
ncbi:MAG: SpoIIE family protein phosphatase [Ruminiclostridium sp.]|nr:SpoIIE family protein phosphatase [Ruminiclostridium sp.]